MQELLVFRWNTVAHFALKSIMNCANALIKSGNVEIVLLAPVHQLSQDEYLLEQQDQLLNSLLEDAHWTRQIFNGSEHVLVATKQTSPQFCKINNNYPCPECYTIQ